MTEVTVFKADGSIYLKKIYSHTKRIGERKIEETILGNCTTVQAKAIYTYDNKGRETELTDFDANGEPGMRLVTRYGANDKPTEIAVFNHSSPTGKIVFAYDSQGNLKENTEYDAAGLQGSKHLFSGDLNGGSQNEMAEYDAKGKLVNKESYVREFDSHGNWIKETKSKWNGTTNRFEPTEVSYRTITYY